MPRSAVDDAVLLDGQCARIALEFMQRATLQGKEVSSFAIASNWLTGKINTAEQVASAPDTSGDAMVNGIGAEGE